MTYVTDSSAWYLRPASSGMVKNLSPELRLAIEEHERMFNGNLRRSPVLRDGYSLPPKIAAHLRERSRELHEQLLKFATERNGVIREALNKISPRAVFRMHPLLSSDSPTLRTAGVGLAIWLAGAGGLGDSEDEESLKRLLDLVDGWLAARSLAHRYFPIDLSISRYDPRADEVRRLFNVETRHVWVTEFICARLCRAIQSHPAASTALSAASEPAITALFDHLRNAWDSSDVLSAVPSSTDELARLLAPEESWRPRIDCAWAVATGIQERFPFVRMAGASHPLALTKVLHSLELSLLDLVRRTCGGVTQGEVYEAAARACISEVAPPRMDVHGPLEMSPHQAVDPLETDFIVSEGTECKVVGECKGLLPATSVAGVSASFSTDLTKALQQLDKRIAWGKKGSRWQDGSDASQSFGLARAHAGLAVPLHGYGMAVWGPDALDLLQKTQHLVIPLPSLVWALSLMQTDKDFYRYLHWRSIAFTNGCTSLDEHEFLIGYVCRTTNGDRFSTLDRPIMVAHTIHTDVSIFYVPPEDRRVRVSDFLKNSIIAT